LKEHRTDLFLENANRITLKRTATGKGKSNQSNNFKYFYCS